MSSDDSLPPEGGDDALAAEYVLGLLPEDERIRFAARLATEPSLRASVRTWKARLATLDSEFAEEPPPPNQLRRIEARLFGAPRERQGLWNNARFWRSFAAVTAAFAIMSVAINLSLPTPDPTMFSARLVASLHGEGAGASFIVLYNPQTQQIRLTTMSGDPVPEKDYQLWAIAGDKPPMPIGLVKMDKGEDMPLTPDIMPLFGPGITLAVSLEQKGGSPTGQPQGPIVATGKAMPV